ncbi:hypothetical protein PLESTB_000129400 [Pleodorina starrii]|uniref:Uncharacterized protein n=1 Tax=Pleodorina starrii TaxID=330485 RepID=A0A9W6EXY5_9CHLO|nr:hypothetical protein PLESTM_000488600 [Pleodorina starrii]GLC48720.1 hypothetical protein PLESTB_000129400 [Pleodorina starrii]GLC74272.1 hypothetical protein PLESTF_001483400 [Pleodorina starrii]
MAEKESGFGQNVLGKLKLVGGKVVDFGGTVAGRVADVGGTVGNKIGDFGNKIVDVATKPLFESDFERLRQLNQVAKQQQDLRRKYTEQELLAVEARADLVLGQLYTGYFEQNFDPVAYELSKLNDSDNQDHIDELVERLTQGVETVSGRLSRHVNKKRDVLLAGIDRVAEVEDDLKAAFLISRSSRATLKAAAEEVQRNMRVVGQTRRKQSFMELMEVISKIKRARDLQHSLKKSQELGEYGDAIMTCVQCFQGLESLRQLTVCSELRVTVQRLYLDTLRRMDGALTNICAEFDPDKYTKILEGYLLQGIDGKALADKVLQCFKDSIHDVTTRVVRSLLLTKPKLADRLAAGASATSALQLGYGELLRAMTPDLLRPCLLRLLETVSDVLASYHVMAHWHGLAVQKEGQMAEAAQGMGEEARRAQSATAAFLTAVNDVLKTSRGEVLETAGRRIKELLAMEHLFKGEDFLQVVDWCGKFGAMGEAFLGGPTELRPQVMALCARFLPAYHRSNLESLTTCLNNEAWQDVGAVTGASGAVTLELDDAILHSPLYMPHWGEDNAVTTFDKWMTSGNPFKRGTGQGAVAEGRQKSLVDLLQRTTEEGKQLSRHGSQQSGLGDAGATGGDGAAAAAAAGGEDADGAGGSAAVAAEPQPAAAAAGSDAAGPSSASLSTGLSTSVSGAVEGSDASLRGAGSVAAGAPGRGAPRRPAMLTISSQQALKYMKHYGEIMRPLEGYSETLFRCLAEMFDVFLLYCFSAFGGLGLEDLVWRDDLLAPRLKGALLRILTADGSKYKTVIEELARNKPVGRGAPIAATGLGLLDRFGDKMESLADSMERSVSRMAVKLGDSKIVQVMGGPADSSVHMAGVQGSGASMVGFPQVSAPNTGMLTPLGGPRSSGPIGSVGGAHEGGSPGGGSTGSPGGGGGSSGQAHSQWGLRERVVAVESLMYMAQELKAAKQAIILALPGRCQRDVEQYFNRSVEAATDLREYLFKAAARVMMQGVWDSERGIPAAIGVTNYNVREPAIKQSPWADFSVRALHTFREKVLAARLPLPLVVMLWEFAVAVVADGLLTGLAGVRKCSLEGRANMNFDLNHVERQIRAMGPPNFKPAALAPVDAYIKAFYLPWEELPRWCQTHVAEYGKQRLFTLVEVSAEFNKVKRGQKNEVLELIEATDPTKSF